MSLDPQQNEIPVPADQASEPKAYPSSWSHLADELKRLDLIIRLKVLSAWKRQPSSPLDQFKGLVVTDAEVASLLGEMLDSSLDSSTVSADTGSAEPDRSTDIVEARESLERLESDIAARRAASVRDGVYLALHRISRIFSLSGFEERCLLICFAAELDRRYEKLYAYLQDDVTRKKPSVDLVFSLATSSFEEKIAARNAFDPRSPLLRYRLVQLFDPAGDGFSPLLSRSLRLDDRVAAFLLGIQQIDYRLDGLASIQNEGLDLSGVVFEETRRRVQEILETHFREDTATRRALAVHLVGPRGSGRRAVAEIAASQLRLPLLTVDLAKVLRAPVGFSEALCLAGREALLQPAMLCFENLQVAMADDQDSIRGDQILETARECSWVTFLIGDQPWRPPTWSNEPGFVAVPVPAPDDAERVRVWRHMTSGLDLDSAVDLGELASKFQFTQGQIRDALMAARDENRWRAAASRQITAADLMSACRAQSGQKLNSLARKVNPIYTWSELVLPEDALTQLREISERLMHRHRVMGDWGFGKKLSLGKGVNALFAGPSGAGKTMAAEVIANELQLDMYKIDLSGVVSKYIGETEKNLDRVFAAAEDANAILFFDEADSLFGKRSEVRDSHDRYANIEISYLLQRMEEYEGLAILATNLKANLDESFTRRLAFTIHFPFPDEASRLLIWRGIWPREMELDESVDLELMANRFKLSGGNIKNIALGAAFLAASNGGRVSMSHLIHATRREYQKLGKPLTDVEMSLTRGAAG